MQPTEQHQWQQPAPKWAPEPATTRLSAGAIAVMSLLLLISLANLAMVFYLYKVVHTAMTIGSGLLGG